MAKRSLPELNHPVAWCRSRASHSHTCLRCDSPCTGWIRSKKLVWIGRWCGLRPGESDILRENMIESFSRKFLSLCLKTLELSSYRRRRISDRVVACLAVAISSKTCCSCTSVESGLWPAVRNVTIAVSSRAARLRRRWSMPAYRTRRPRQIDEVRIRITREALDVL